AFGEQPLARQAIGEQGEVILDLCARLQPREFDFIDDLHVLDGLMDFLGESIDHGLVERFFVAVLVRCLHCAPNATPPRHNAAGCRSFLSEVFLAEMSDPTTTRSLLRRASACLLLNFHHSMKKPEDIAARGWAREHWMRSATDYYKDFNFGGCGIGLIIRSRGDSPGERDEEVSVGNGR